MVDQSLNDQVKGLRIKIYDDEKLLMSSVFEQHKVVIGRILSADFKVAHPKISRIHALVELLANGKLRITDLASTHGTFVNGQRVVEKSFTFKDTLSLAGLKLVVSPLIQEESTVESTLPSQSSLATSDASSQQSMGADEVDGVYRPRENTQIRSIKSLAKVKGVESGSSGDGLELTVFWEETVLSVDHYRKSCSVYVGSNAANDYVIPDDLIGERFQLLKIKNSKSVQLNIHPKMKGALRQGKSISSLDEIHSLGTKSLTLGSGDIAKISLGRVNFFFMFVERPPITPLAPFFDQGTLFWSLQVSMAIMAAVLLSLILAIPTTIEGTVKEFPERYRKIVIESFKVKQEKKKQEKIVSDKNAGTNSPVPKKVTKTGGNAGEGAKEKGAEGKRGKTNSKNKSGITNRPKVKDTKKTVDAPKKAKANPAKTRTKVTAEKPKKVDLLETLKRSGLGLKIAKVAGGGGAAGQDPLDKALSGVGGGQQSSAGPGGSGLKSTGQGGGGEAVGVGGLGNKGFAGGARGSGRGSIPGKGDVMVGTEGSGVSVLGGLTREQIRRVVNAHHSEVEFCYQQSLQRDPGLFGKVNVAWTIVGGGNVVNVKTLSNSTGSSYLASCLQKKVRRWRFPSPPTGSKADVEWPWLFKPKS